MTPRDWQVMLATDQCNHYCSENHYRYRDMEKIIQATAANRSFSRILREVAQGDSYTVTSHGRPIARIVPASGKGSEAAKQRLLEYLRQQPTMEIGPFNREELYNC